MAGAAPIDEAEARALFGVFSSCSHVALAVSGGPDSVALMALAARWARHAPAAPRLTVLSVDHGLRPEAADEVRQVRAQAARLGLPCRVLRWRGEKPRAGLQARARAARYALLGQWCAAHGAALATAHTLQDQAETLLMRLARGSGVDGLSAMSRIGETPFVSPPVPLLRPLLDIPAARLRASARAAGLTWVEDPSNDNPAYERVRARKALTALEEAGLLEPAALARAARRLAGARDALEAARDAWLEKHLLSHPAGWGELPLPPLRAAPREIRLRVLARAARLFGSGARPSLSALERLDDWLTSGEGRARTLAGARFARRKAAVICGREPGRLNARAIISPKSPRALWDNRFRIEVSGARAPLEVRALRETPPDPAIPPRPREIPAFVWESQPVLRRAGRLAALPLSGWLAPDAPLERAAAVFVGRCST